MGPGVAMHVRARLRPGGSGGTSLDVLSDAMAVGRRAPDDDGADVGGASQRLCGTGPEVSHYGPDCGMLSVAMGHPLVVAADMPRMVRVVNFLYGHAALPALEAFSVRPRRTGGTSVHALVHGLWPPLPDAPRASPLLPPPPPPPPPPAESDAASVASVASGQSGRRRRRHQSRSAAMRRQGPPMLRNMQTSIMLTGGSHQVFTHRVPPLSALAVQHGVSHIVHVFVGSGAVGDPVGAYRAGVNAAAFLGPGSVVFPTLDGLLRGGEGALEVVAQALATHPYLPQVRCVLTVPTVAAAMRCIVAAGDAVLAERHARAEASRVTSSDDDGDDNGGDECDSSRCVT